jgi:hypothetical protein
LVFSFLYHCQDFYRTWLYIWVIKRVSYKKQGLVTHGFLVRFVLLVFVLSYYVSLLYISYLRYLCLFAYSGAQHILCCGFFVCFSSFCAHYVVSFSGLSILIAPSVFSDVYFQCANIWHKPNLVMKYQTLTCQLSKALIIITVLS